MSEEIKELDNHIKKLEAARLSLTIFNILLTDGDKLSEFSSIQEYNNAFNLFTAICDFNIDYLKSEKERT